MRTISPVSVIIFSGCTWLAIGIMLLVKGLGILASSLEVLQPSAILLPIIAKYTGDLQQGALILIVFAIGLGFFKGRFVLAKTAKKVIARLADFQGKVPLNKIYAAKYCIMLSSMMLLGMSLRLFHCPPDLKAFLDITVGSALINGATIYFRSAFVKTYL